jgi:hypothetical protein
LDLLRIANADGIVDVRGRRRGDPEHDQIRNSAVM